MKPFKLTKKVKPSGYMQFWTHKKPPTIIITQFPKPNLPIVLLNKVNPRGTYVEFTYID